MAALTASIQSPVAGVPGLRGCQAIKVGSSTGSSEQSNNSQVIRRRSDAPESQLTPAVTPTSTARSTGDAEPFRTASDASSTAESALVGPEGVKTNPGTDHKALPLRSSRRPSRDLTSQRLVFRAPEEQPSKRPSSVRQHRKNALSVDAAVRQATLKALPSQGPRSAGRHLSIAPTPSSPSSSQGVEHNRPQTARTTETSWRHSRPPALSNLGIAGPLLEKDPLTARPSMLQSPCFFHRRFDDAVNLERVLEEISGDEGMSHSRLMQTATGVREVSRQLQRRPIKRAVRNIMIVTKARDHELVTLTRELAEWLMTTPRYGSDVGVNVYVDAKLRHSKRFDAAGLLQKNARFEEMLNYWTPHLCWSSSDRFDLVVTLGGDGTVLFTSWLFQRIVPPVLSFSLGSLGFLTNFQFDDYRQHLDRVMGDSGMKVNLRMRFTCTVYRCRNRSRGRRHGGEPEFEQGEQFEVLNELVIDRGPSPYVSNLELYGDDELLTVVQADGCIFSTPTGTLPCSTLTAMYHILTSPQDPQPTPYQQAALWCIQTSRPSY